MMKLEKDQENLAIMMEEAKQLCLEEPWKWMDDIDLFGIRLPGQDVVFCSVMGGAGAVYGIIFYPGLRGLKSFLEILNSQGEELQLLYTQMGISVEYLDRTELDACEYQLIRDSGVPFRGRKHWPSFLKMVPGYLPQNPPPDDYAQIGALLSGARKATAFFKEHPEQRSLFQQDQVLVLTLNKKGTASTKILDIEDYMENQIGNQKIPVVQHDLEVRVLRDQCQYINETWEIDAFYQGIPVDGDPPFVPYLMLLADPSDGAILLTHLSHPQAAQREFQEVLFSFFQENNILPRKMVTTNLELYSVLEHLLSRLAISFYIVEELFLLPMMKSQLLESIEEKFGKEIY